MTALPPTISDMAADPGAAHDLTAPRRRRDRGSRSRQNRRTAIGFLAPFLVAFTLFYLLPIGYAVYQSFLKVEREGRSVSRTTCGAASASTPRCSRTPTSGTASSTSPSSS